MPAFLFQIVVTAISSMVLGVFTGVQALPVTSQPQGAVPIPEYCDPQGVSGLLI